jgi:hypothetical protein
MCQQAMRLERLRTRVQTGYRPFNNAVPSDLTEPLPNISTPSLKAASTLTCPRAL